MFHLETSEKNAYQKPFFLGESSIILPMFRSASLGTLQCGEVGGQSVHRSGSPGSESGSVPQFPEISIGKNSEELISLVTRCPKDVTPKM